MKKIFLLLALAFISAQSIANSCPDGSDPVKSLSADGSYYEYNCDESSNTSITSRPASYVDNDLDPTKEQCNDLFKGQRVVNNVQKYINLHADANYKVYNNNLYSYVAKSGRVTRNGPFSLWLYDELLDIAKKYRPIKFEKESLQGIRHKISW